MPNEKSEANKVKKFITDEKPAYTNHEKPVVDVPSVIRQVGSSSEINRIKQESLKQYKEAKSVLNESIADVATHDVRALEFAGEMSERVLIVMEIAIELGLVKTDGIESTAEQQQKVGVSAEAIAARSPDLLGELKKNAVLTRIVGERNPKSGPEIGNLSEAGFVGLSPLAMQNATHGNLRERMYIPFKSTHSLVKELFAPAENVARINARLKEKGMDWQLNEPVIDGLRAQTANLHGGLFAYGAYAMSREGSRVSNADAMRKEYGQNNPTIKDMNSARMPLSERERLAQSGDLAPDSEKRVQWLPGEAWSRVLESRDHPSIRAADETADPVLTGISGTTDSILTLGHMIGMFDGADKEDKLRDGMVACMGWMVDAKDHTAHEIQTSAQTFGLEYTPGPDSYKQIRPGDKEFLSQLEAAQEKRGFKTPDHYLSAEHVKEIASPLLIRSAATVSGQEQSEPKAQPIETQHQMKEQLEKLRKDQTEEEIPVERPTMNR